MMDFIYPNEGQFTIGFAYGEDRPTIMRALWEEFGIIYVINATPICFLGDFNIVRSPVDSNKETTR